MTDRTLFYRRFFGRFATGVAVILTEEKDVVVGVTVNSLTSASLDPLLLLFCISNESRTGQAILRSRRFTVNILSSEQEPEARYFASRKEVDHDFEYDRREGFVWLARSNAVFCCSSAASHSAGDHRIIIGEVEDMFGPEECVSSLAYHEGRYLNLESRPDTKSSDKGVTE